jgi:hypothetical protein
MVTIEKLRFVANFCDEAGRLDLGNIVLDAITALSALKQTFPIDIDEECDYGEFGYI